MEGSGENKKNGASGSVRNVDIPKKGRKAVAESVLKDGSRLLEAEIQPS